MRAFSLCLLALAIASSDANAAGAPELEKLRASYKASVAKGTKSILLSHITSLEKLRDTQARESNLAGATKVQSDIDRANVAISTGEFIPPGGDAELSVPELDKIREKHEAVIERALKPYREAYARDLDKLRDNFTRTANLAAAQEVQAEIDEVKSEASGKPTASQAAGKQPRLSGKAPKSEWYVGKTWKEIKGPGPLWTFAKGGKGEVEHASGKTFPMTWDVLPNGVLKLDHPPSGGVGMTSAYMYITSATEGMCGLGTDNLNRPLQLAK